MNRVQNIKLADVVSIRMRFCRERAHSKRVIQEVFHELNSKTIVFEPDTD